MRKGNGSCVRCLTGAGTEEARFPYQGRLCTSCATVLDEDRLRGEVQERHADHGVSDDYGVPEAADCPCRGTRLQSECAGTDCGFCRSAVRAQE